MPCCLNRWQHLLTTNLAVVVVVVEETAVTAAAVAAKRRHQLSPARTKNLLSLQTAEAAAVVVIGHPTLSWAFPLCPQQCPKVCWK